MSTLHHESILETILDEVCEELNIEYNPMNDSDVNHAIELLVNERFEAMSM
tara:strand:+ start:867 stop:1019 length:153 start_codon:yes stop_codon:yes gene_type:complete